MHRGLNRPRAGATRQVGAAVRPARRAHPAIRARQAAVGRSRVHVPPGHRRRATQVLRTRPAPVQVPCPPPHLACLGLSVGGPSLVHAFMPPTLRGTYPPASACWARALGGWTRPTQSRALVTGHWKAGGNEQSSLVSGSLLPSPYPATTAGSNGTTCPEPTRRQRRQAEEKAFPRASGAGGGAARRRRQTAPGTRGSGLFLGPRVRVFRNSSHRSASSRDGASAGSPVNAPDACAPRHASTA
jgi:hypothetical protein